MATKLKETDVVIVGMGAAGGVAALPLDAGRSRGGRSRSRHMAHAPRFRARRNSQQLSRLAHGRAESESGSADRARNRRDERCRRAIIR